MKGPRGNIPELEYLRTLPLRSDRVIGRHKYPHFAVFVPFLSLEGVTHWLFEKRSVTIRQGGEICFPGGAVELENGEHPEEAARRETSEELGIPLEAVKIAGYLGHLFTRWGGLIDVFYGTLAPPHEPESQGNRSVGEEPAYPAIRPLTLDLHPKKDEVDTVFTVPISFFRTTKPDVHQFRQVIQPRFKDSKGKLHDLPWKQLGLPPRYGRSFSFHTYPVYFYRYQGETIWGITADIIKEFLELLNFPQSAVHYQTGGNQS
jgi:coenzyme A diphosphatase NUDT7